jgi:hypothetical protein
VANEQKKPSKDRTREIEQLAAQLFVELYCANADTKQPAGAARGAIAASREFFRILDEPQITALPLPAKE